jgi:hypothetical protein
MNGILLICIFLDHEVVQNFMLWLVNVSPVGEKI